MLKPQSHIARIVLAALLVHAVVFAIAPSVVHAQPAPEVALSVDRNDITVGDPIVYLVTVRYDTSLHIIGPAIARSIGPFTVLGDTTLSDDLIEDNRKIYRRQLKLTAFETGDIWIPSIGGELVDTLGHSTAWTTDSVNIAVISVLGDVNPDSADLRAIKAQYEAPTNTWIYWLVAGVLVIGGAIAWWFWRRRRGETAGEPERIIPAWEAAFTSLETMRREIDPSTDGGRLWYFRLSEILRRYFDQRYGWSSIDETTSQLLRRLVSAPFDPQHQDRVREFFREADRIRYAKTPATDGRPDIDWEWVREFVETTRLRLEAVSEDGNGSHATPDGNQVEPTAQEVQA